MFTYLQEKSQDAKNGRTCVRYGHNVIVSGPCGRESFTGNHFANVIVSKYLYIPNQIDLSSDHLYYYHAIVQVVATCWEHDSMAGMLALFAPAIALKVGVSPMVTDLVCNQGVQLVAVPLWMYGISNFLLCLVYGHHALHKC